MCTILSYGVRGGMLSANKGSVTQASQVLSKPYKWATIFRNAKSSLSAVTNKRK